MSDAYILDAVRTPFGRFGGALAKARPDDLGAHVVKALVERTPDLDPRRSTTSYFGNANGAGEDNRNVARMAALLAGLPTTVPGNTDQPPVRLQPRRRDAGVSRAIETGDADVVLVGGVESMSRAPWVVLKPEKGFPAGPQTMHSTTLGWRMVNPEMPDAVDDLARREHREARRHPRASAARRRTRSRCESHQRAAAAWDAGFYDDWVHPGARHRAHPRRGHPRRHARSRSWPSSSRRSSRTAR